MSSGCIESASIRSILAGWTPMSNPTGVPRSVLDDYMGLHPVTRIGGPEESRARAVPRDDGASFVNGAELAVDGGWIAGDYRPRPGGPAASADDRFNCVRGGHSRNAAPPLIATTCPVIHARRPTAGTRSARRCPQFAKQVSGNAATASSCRSLCLSR
jgi:hypothetical protein